MFLYFKIVLFFKRKRAANIIKHFNDVSTENNCFRKIPHKEGRKTNAIKMLLNAYTQLTFSHRERWRIKSKFLLIIFDLFKQKTYICMYVCMYIVSFFIFIYSIINTCMHTVTTSYVAKMSDDFFFFNFLIKTKQT